MKIQDRIEHSEELKKILKKVRILIAIQYISVAIGLITFFRKSYLITFILMIIALITFVLNMGNKKGFYNVCLNSVVNFANSNRKKLAMRYLNKAKKIEDSIIVQELESLIN